MTVVKNEKVYSVKENKKTWNVSWTLNELSFSVTFPKENCETEKAIREFILSNDLF